MLQGQPAARNTDDVAAGHAALASRFGLGSHRVARRCQLGSSLAWKPTAAMTNGADRLPKHHVRTQLGHDTPSTRYSAINRFRISFNSFRRSSLTSGYDIRNSSSVSTMTLETISRASCLLSAGTMYQGA